MATAFIPALEMAPGILSGLESLGGAAGIASLLDKGDQLGRIASKYAQQGSKLIGEGKRMLGPGGELFNVGSDIAQLYKQARQTGKSIDKGIKKTSNFVQQDIAPLISSVSNRISKIGGAVGDEIRSAKRKLQQSSIEKQKKLKLV